MKMDFRRTLGMLIAVAALMISGIALADKSSTVGADHNASALRLDAVGTPKGRATLTVEDLKTLLGLSARDPSSAAKAGGVEARAIHEESHGAYRFNFKLAPSELHKVARQIQSIEAGRQALIAQSKADIEARKAQIRASRQQMQTARLSTHGESDEALSKSLFENLLAEANLEAHATNELARYDAEHAVQIAFEEHAESRTVESIMIGQETVWAPAHIAIVKN